MRKPDDPEDLAYFNAWYQHNSAAHACTGTLAGLLDMIERGEAKLEPPQIVEVIRRDLAAYKSTFIEAHNRENGQCLH